MTTPPPDKCAATVDPTPATVRELRRRWKPHKERLQNLQSDHPTVVRYHRACSWLQAVEDQPACGLDEQFIHRWIALNSLYGQWDAQQRQPRPDRECWQAFLDVIRQFDRDRRLAALLVEHKRLVMSLLEDPYLNSFFWKAPSETQAKKSRSANLKAHSWYVEQRWATVLDGLLAAVYLLRCQMIHGAATHNSKLNRTSLKRASRMLELLVPTLLTILADHGADHDWGPMCYPPQ